MPISVTFIEGPPVEEMLKSLMPTAEKIVAAANAQIDAMRARTAAGMDVHGAPFAPYMPNSARARLRKGLQTMPVDLRETGEMLNSMRAEVRGPTEFAIVIDDPAVRAKALNEGTARMPAREFFATSEEEMQRMSAQLFASE